MSRFLLTRLGPVLLCAMNFRRSQVRKPAYYLPVPGAPESLFRSRHLSRATIHIAFKQFHTPRCSEARVPRLESNGSAPFPVRRRVYPRQRSRIPFRINTYEIVSKQRTSSTLRINTYAKSRTRGVR